MKILFRNYLEKYSTPDLSLSQTNHVEFVFPKVRRLSFLFFSLRRPRIRYTLDCILISQTVSSSGSKWLPQFFPRLKQNDFIPIVKCLKLPARCSGSNKEPPVDFRRYICRQTVISNTNHCLHTALPKDFSHGLTSSSLRLLRSHNFAYGNSFINHLVRLRSFTP